MGRSIFEVVRLFLVSDFTDIPPSRSLFSMSPYVFQACILYCVLERMRGKRSDYVRDKFREQKEITLLYWILHVERKLWPHQTLGWFSFILCVSWSPFDLYSSSNPLKDIFSSSPAKKCWWEAQIQSTLIVNMNQTLVLFY